MTNLPIDAEKRLRSRDRVIGPAGAAIITVLLAATALSTWWAGGSERQTLRENQQHALKGISSTLHDVIAPLVIHDDVAALRRLIVHMKDSFQLKECRITLPDGRVIADSNPGNIRVATLPEHWTTGPLDAETPATTGDATVSQFPVAIPGRGTLIVYLLGSVQYPAWARSDMQGGLMLIGAAGIGAMLIFFRKMRSHVAVLGMVGDAVTLAEGANDNAEFLRINGDFGPIAASWNGLIARQEKLHKELTEKRTRELVGVGAGNAPELETACDALADGMAMLGADGVARYANGAACAFLGTERDALLRVPFVSLIKDTGLQRAIEQVLSGAERQRRQLQIEEKQGEAATILRYDIRPMRCNGTEEVLVTIHDVTQQRVADAARNSFVAHITHELRTPLTTIGLYLDTAANEGEKDPALRAKCLNIITQESKRLERIVTEMLSVSEIEAGSMRLNLDDIRLDALFDGLCAESEAPAKSKNIQLAFDMPPKYPVIRGDRERVSLVVHNLLGNAIKYTPAGGAVKVTLKVEPQQIRVEVSDSGIGIDEKEQEQIFDRFYRSQDPRVGKIIGTGLGLTLAREIARLHGGNVTVQSQINKGSTFILTLPLNIDRR